ncbi:hypothetical protein F4778DRAFT_783133 [Xylariomycetidae sp. FL2044]|nr:hypothetical protein F4778DRAFT_783133 [Xylariomycetidae sp. FL2044]
MPSGQGYSYKGSGTNSQSPSKDAHAKSWANGTLGLTRLASGNHYCARDYGSGASNSNSYHYSNSDGSYYYSNPNGSTYHMNASGGSTYTPSSGNSGSSGSSGKK